jgi:hypothetical protein
MMGALVQRDSRRFGVVSEVDGAVGEPPTWPGAMSSLRKSPAAATITIDLGGDDMSTIRRTTTQTVRSVTAHRPRKARTTHVS